MQSPGRIKLGEKNQSYGSLVPAAFGESPWHGLFREECTGTVWVPRTGRSHIRAGEVVSTEVNGAHAEPVAQSGAPA